MRLTLTTIILLLSLLSFSQLQTSGNISLSDVKSELGLTGSQSLEDCFTAATGTFNATYEGSRDRLTNFYGYSHGSTGCPLSDPSGFSINSSTALLTWDVASSAEQFYMADWEISYGTSSGTYTTSFTVPETEAGVWFPSSATQGVTYYVIIQKIGANFCSDSSVSTELSFVYPAPKG